MLNQNASTKSRNKPTIQWCKRSPRVRTTKKMTKWMKIMKSCFMSRILKKNLKVGSNRTSFTYYDPFYRTYKYTMTEINFSSSTGFWTWVPWHSKQMTYPLCYNDPTSLIFLIFNFIHSFLCALNKFFKFFILYKPLFVMKAKSINSKK